MITRNIERIQLVGEGLGPLNDEVAYVGGAVIEFYADRPAAEDIRTTEDVDIVVEVSSPGKFHLLEEKLRKLGFRNDFQQGAPICRWIYKDVVVDVMPDRGDVVGFSNPWYPYGIQEKIPRILPSGLRIFIFPPAYFLATKLEATLGRGMSDLRTSQDFEDVVFLLDNCSGILDNTRTANPEVCSFIASTFERLSNLPIFQEAISCSLPLSAQDRAGEIQTLVRSFSRLQHRGI